MKTGMKLGMDVIEEEMKLKWERGKQNSSIRERWGIGGAGKEGMIMPPNIKAMPGGSRGLA